MSTTAKIVLVVVVAVVVIGGGIWWWAASQANTNVGYNSPATSTSMANEGTVANNSTTTTSSSQATSQDDSDQAIQQDMTSVNTQTNGFSSDSASMNQSMNDQPVSQGQ
jgi:cytoskeletal protein RodZ